MPREQGAESGEPAERRDSSGLNDWQRIDAEQAERDAIGRKWDATHDPSPEFENSAMPLGPDYGRDRPKQREYTPEQKAELEAAFGRPIEELLALRDKDPRAGHNRDEQGRILDADGNPREFVDPREALLRKQAVPGERYAEKPQPEPSNRPEVVPSEPPDGKFVTVRLDEHGRPDWTTARYDDGASRADQLQSDRRIRAEFGDQAAEPPKPAGDELTEDVERDDLDTSRRKPERALSHLLRRGEDAQDTLQEWGDTGKDLLTGPQGGRAETRMPQGDVVISAQRPEYLDGGDTLSMIGTLGIMLGAAYVRVSRSRRSEQEN